MRRILVRSTVHLITLSSRCHYASDVVVGRFSFSFGTGSANIFSILFSFSFRGPATIRLNIPVKRLTHHYKGHPW